MISDLLIIEILICQPKSVDSSGSSRILNRGEATTLNNYKPATSEKPSSANSSLTSIPIYTKLNRKETGLISPKGMQQSDHREYNYDVILTGLGYSFMAANAVMSWRIFVKKRMVWWPLAVITPAAYMYFSPL